MQKQLIYVYTRSRRRPLQDRIKSRFYISLRLTHHMLGKSEHCCSKMEITKPSILLCILFIRFHVLSNLKWMSQYEADHAFICRVSISSSVWQISPHGRSNSSLFTDRISPCFPRWNITSKYRFLFFLWELINESKPVETIDYHKDMKGE